MSRTSYPAIFLISSFFQDAHKSHFLAAFDELFCLVCHVQTSLFDLSKWALDHIQTQLLSIKYQCPVRRNYQQRPYLNIKPPELAFSDNHPFDNLLGSQLTEYHPAISLQSFMSLGEYVLQATPKRVQFKQPTAYVKVSTSLSFGDLQYKSQYARYIRSNQGSFYGQRLKLNNLLNQKASFTVIGIGKAGEQIVLAKINLNVIDLADKEQPTQKVYEDEEIRFQYQVLVFEREISDEEYEEVLSNKASDKPLDNQPMLLNILSSDLDEKMPEINLDQPKQVEVLETPRLYEQENPDPPDVATFKQLDIDQSPIGSRTQIEAPQPKLRSSLKLQSSILSPRSERAGQEKRIQKSILSPTRVTFQEPPKQPKQSGLSSFLSLVLYGAVSITAFFAGVQVRLLTDE